MVLIPNLFFLKILRLITHSDFNKIEQNDVRILNHSNMKCLI